jgi:YD repeat-containing protein
VVLEKFDWVFSEVPEVDRVQPLAAQRTKRGCPCRTEYFYEGKPAHHAILARYDDEGFPIEIDGGSDRTSCQKKTDGHRVCVHTLGSSTRSFTSEHDATGLLLAMHDGGTASKVDYELVTDARGFVVEMKLEGRSGKLVWDDDGKLREIVLHQQRHVFSYDAHGRLVEARATPTDDVDEKTRAVLGVHRTRHHYDCSREGLPAR